MRRLREELINCITILPLIVLLLLDHLHSHLASKFLEPKPPQWLGENVTELLSRLNIPNLDLPFLDAVTDVVEFGVYVFAAIV
jgi:hypothetical protein